MANETPERGMALLAKVFLNGAEAAELRGYVLGWIEDHAKLQQCCMEGCPEKIQWSLPFCETHFVQMQVNHAPELRVRVSKLEAGLDVAAGQLLQLADAPSGWTELTPEEQASNLRTWAANAREVLGVPEDRRLLGSRVRETGERGGGGDPR